MSKKLKLLKAFLEFYWLRPESALMLTLRSLAYQKSLVFFDKKNSLDVCCGDGAFSFLTFNGRFDPITDMYRSIKISRKTVRSIDSFDKFDKSYFVKIKKNPSKKFSHGCDWKENLLSKSRKLNFYKNLFIHNINQDFLINDMQKFNFVYSNSTYWSNNFDKHLQSLSDIANTNGHIVLQIKNNSIFSNYVLEEKYKKTFGEKFTRIIDAGRKETWRSLRSHNEIYNSIKSNKNLKILDVYPIYGDVLPHIWNFGLRPIFEPLYLMSNFTNPKNRLRAKQLFVQTFFDMFKDYISNFDPNLPKNKVQMEYTYILKKI